MTPRIRIIQHEDRQLRCLLCNLIQMLGSDPDQHTTELPLFCCPDDPQQRLIYLAPADVGGHLGRPDGHFRCAVSVTRRDLIARSGFRPFHCCQPEHKPTGWLPDLSFPSVQGRFDLCQRQEEWAAQEAVFNKRRNFRVREDGPPRTFHHALDCLVGFTTRRLGLQRLACVRVTNIVQPP